ncbi:MAG TPA: hypothetical protein DDY58_12210 [Terrisporobacter glycolicus]|uniref:hypothetical protein n=1 Tax=Terrisporobacter hibernicus TaxID=2813371 RepID=UPI000E8A441E|nr:hypothetical protein [Terrisporobacter hibernicus]HBI93114.1 hypothetical protein [Terrisporobacter hibernicus]
MREKVFTALTIGILCLGSTGVFSNAEEVKNESDKSIPVGAEEQSEKIFKNDTLRKEVVYSLNQKENRISGSNWEKKDTKTYNPTIEDMKLLRRISITDGLGESVDTIEGIKYAVNLDIVSSNS